MLLQRASECLVAIAILSSAAIDWHASNGPMDFGEVDPAYRSSHSDTAWFLHQDDANAAQVPVAKDDDDDDDANIVAVQAAKAADDALGW